MAAKYGIPYFSNYINSDMSPSDVRSMCCRLRLDLRELRRRAGGNFGAGESTGSVGVVTLNLPRMAYLSNSEEEFLSMVNKYMDIAARSLDTKRSIITRMLDNGLYPYTKRYLGNFNNHFSTIGLVGMNEAILNAKWMTKGITIADKEGNDFAKMVLDHMRERLSDYQEKYEGTLFNLEATPAESTSYRLAKHDKKDFPDILSASNGDTPFYTNSSHIPVGFTGDVFEALDLQDDLQTKYTSGTVFHAFLGERLPDWHAAASLVRKIAENYKLPYYTLSPTYSVCKNHGYITGEVDSCPNCHEETEVYSRITGYYRPVKNWNNGKTQEFKQRKTYDAISSMKHREETENEENQFDGCDSCKIDFGEEVDVKTTEISNESKLLLVTTNTCPNCKMAKSKLDAYGIKYDVMLVDDDINFVKANGITTAPTLLVISNGVVTEKYSMLGNIMKYIKENLI